MSAGKIVLRNTIFAYARTLMSAALTLFSSRWILAELGAADYGVYGLVGGLLFFVSFISSILSQGTGRYLAYATGTGDPENVTKWFNAALNVFSCLPFILIPIGLAIGEVVVRFILKIDALRIFAALWVFRCSLFSFFAVMLATPFLSLLMAKQKIHIAAMLMLFHSVGLFIIAIVLPYLPGDHLIVYAVLVAMSLGILQILYITVCRRICPEARVVFSYWWDADKIKSLVGFSGWLCVGTIGTVVNTQGQGVLLNLMRGTSANAGSSVAGSLGGQMQTLANAFLQAISPEVIRREGASNHSGMIALAKQATKLGVAFIMLVALPLFCECEYVLKLWLVNPPPYAVFFTRVTILSALFYKMAVGHRICFQATGKIKSQQIIELTVYAITVPMIPLVYVISHSVYISFSFVPVMQVVYFFATTAAGAKIYEWSLKDVVVSVFLKGLLCFILGVLLFRGILVLSSDGSFMRLCFSTALLCLFVCVYFALFVLSDADKRLVSSYFAKVINRIV